MIDVPTNQRGLIVMDESKQEKPLQTLARKFRIDEARWGHFRNLAEVPLFVDSRASRMIQVADLVAWFTFRKYEYKDGRFFDPIILMARLDLSAALFHLGGKVSPLRRKLGLSGQRRGLALLQRLQSNPATLWIGNQGNQCPNVRKSIVCECRGGHGMDMQQVRRQL